MVKHNQTIRRSKPATCLSVFDHFVGLALKGLRQCQRSMMELLCENRCPTKIKKIISGVALLFGTGEYAANLQETTHVEVRFQ